MKSIRTEERKNEVEIGELEQATLQKEIEKIKAGRDRITAEMNEKTKALVN
jgi:hypothetical protein